MMDWTNPMQSPESPQPDQSSASQPLLPPPQPVTIPLPPSTEQSPWPGQPLLPQQPMTVPIPPYQLPMNQPPRPGQPLLLPQQPVTIPIPPPPPPTTAQLSASQSSLRNRYRPEQIELYFSPYPDRGPEIRRLQQLIGQLYKKIWSLVFVGLALLVLFIVSASQGGIYLGLLELAGIIGIGVLISRTRTELQPHNNALQRELALEASEKERTRRVQPPNERQYDEWISAISDDIYKNAPTRLRLHEHPDHIAWRKAVNSGHYLSQPEPEPEEFGASLCLEGRIATSDESNESPPQLQKWTRDSLRVKHYSVYEFTALFITEDYVAIYTSIVNLRDAMWDREEFEYCYHQHLSHMSLNVSTTLQNVDIQPPKQILFQESRLLLTFDSGRTIRRNISTLHIGNQSITSIANIHEKLTKSLIDHGKSMKRSFQGVME